MIGILKFKCKKKYIRRKSKLNAMLTRKTMKKGADELTLTTAATNVVWPVWFLERGDGGPNRKAEVERVRLFSGDRGFYRWCSGRVE